MSTKLIIQHDRQTFKSEEERIKAYQNLFKTDQGEQVLIDILSHAGFFNPAIPESSNDAFAQAGKRQMCNFILNFLSITNVKKDS